MPGVAEEHPNRGVSKLALLRGANEHIVRLDRRVKRRDDVIEKMRKELEMLRLEVGVGAVLEENEDENEDVLGDEGRESGGVAGMWKGMKLVNLTADLDAIERDEEEERSARLAARPSEALARLASLHQSSSSS